MGRKQRQIAECDVQPALEERSVLAARLFAEGIAHHQAGRIPDAERHYRRIVELQPDHAESFSNLALALIMQGNFSEAIEASEEALKLRADYLEAHLNLAAAFEALRQFDKAVAVYHNAIAVAPDRPALWNNLGVNYDRLGAFDKAVEAFQQALALRDDDPDTHFNLARALGNLGHTDAAIAAYRHLIAIAPDQAAPYSNLGTLLCSVSKYEEAADAGLLAANLAPDNPEIFCNLGVILQRKGNLSDAVVAYKRALELKPDYAIVYGNLGVAFQELFKFDDAVDALTRAVALKPDFDSAIIELIKMRRHVCDWSSYQADLRILSDLIEQQKDNMFMLLLMAFPSTPAQQADCARQAMARLNALTPRFSTYERPTGSRRIRIGYISHDFRDHPVGRLLPEFFARHDRSRFEVFGYSLGNEDGAPLRQRIRKGCDHFTDLHTMSNAESANKIHADGIDVLVDLTGPAVGSRLEILADRPAPVQVSFIGWPGTMGLRCIDYIVADPFLLPFDQQPYYSEKIVHLADCYQPCDLERQTIQPPLTRADCGLPDDAFVFCSFNNTVKITPEVFDIWMRLLKRVPGSVLWLYCKSEATIANLRRRAEEQGIATDRIVFASLAAMSVYLDRLRIADLFLDSNPYNAGATCNDALWVGLPVLTCAGSTYVSRMAGSLLGAAGVPELITYSLEDYEARAVQLATDPHELKGLRRRLVEGRATARLFDMDRFTRNLEGAYGEMTDIWRAGGAPRPFAAKPLGRAKARLDPSMFRRLSHLAALPAVIADAARTPSAV